MNLLQFFRLLIRNLKWLLIFPSALVLVVFMLTKKQENQYYSTTTVYTGFASGIELENGERRKIDILSVNVAFDNLINIIKTRETKEEIVLRLLAHHLSLKGKADKTISAAHLEHMKEIFTEKDIKSMQVADQEDKIYEHLQMLRQSSYRKNYSLTE